MRATAPRSLVLVARGTPHSLTHSLARSLASPSLGGARSPWTTGPSSMAASRASSHRRPSSRPFCVLRRASKLPQPDAHSPAGHLRPPRTRGASRHCRQVKLHGRHPRSSFEPPPSQSTSPSTSPLARCLLYVTFPVAQPPAAVAVVIRRLSGHCSHGRANSGSLGPSRAIL